MIGPAATIMRALAAVEFVSIFRDHYHEIGFACGCVRTPTIADWCNVHELLPEPVRGLVLGLEVRT